MSNFQEINFNWFLQYFSSLIGIFSVFIRPKKNSRLFESMGGWVLEISKMALYLSVPVAAFHVFNTPQYFEKYVVEKKREMYPHEDELYREEVSLLFKDMRSGNLESKINELQQMEAERKKRKETESKTAA